MERIKTFNGSALKYYSWETGFLFNSPKWRRLLLSKWCLTNTACLNHKQDFPWQVHHYIFLGFGRPVQVFFSGTVAYGFPALKSRSCIEKKWVFNCCFPRTICLLDGWRDLEVRKGLSQGTELSGHCSKLQLQDEDQEGKATLTLKQQLLLMWLAWLLLWKKHHRIFFLVNIVHFTPHVFCQSQPGGKHTRL